MGRQRRAELAEIGGEPAGSGRSVLNEAREVQLAIELFKLGARLQLLEAETSLSRNRLIRLYKELIGGSPPKGMLPFSIDWFLTWLPNIHSSLFARIHKQLVEHTGERGMEAIVKSYKLYLEQMPPEPGKEPLLSLTRAWTLMRFLVSGMLTTERCRSCGGEFLIRPDGRYQFVCGLCRVPSRAGKTRKSVDESGAASIC